jgi:hypothetical protein
VLRNYSIREAEGSIIDAGEVKLGIEVSPRTVRKYLGDHRIKVGIPHSTDERGVRAGDRDDSARVSGLADSPLGVSSAECSALLGSALQWRTAAHGVGSRDSRCPTHPDCQTDFASSPRSSLRRSCRSDSRRTASRVHLGGGRLTYLNLTPISADHNPGHATPEE